METTKNVFENDSQRSPGTSDAAWPCGNVAADEWPILGPRAALDDPAVLRGIEDWLGPGMRTEDLGGSVNLNVKITNGRGATALVRVHRPWESLARLRAVRELRRRLRTRGLRVATPLRGRSDGIARVAGRWAEIEEYVPVTLGAPEPQRLVAALVTLHERGRGCWDVDWPRPALPNFDSGVRVAAWLAHSRHRLQRLGFWEEFGPTATRLVGLLQRHDVDVGRELPEVLTHGDLTWTNCGFSPTGDPVYLDFDVAAPAPRLSDLASMAMALVHEQGGDAASLLTVGHDLLRTYSDATSVPVTRCERRCLPVELLRASLTSAARAGLTSADSGPRDQLAGGIALARALEPEVVGRLRST